MADISPERFKNIDPMHVGLLEETLQAPSAHNAQPWQIRPLDDGTYEIHYSQSPDLPTDDPASKDAYLTMGAFVETMALRAPNRGLEVAVSPELTRNGIDLYIARIAIGGLRDGAEIDPLSAFVGQRHTNRNPYKKDPLTPELEDKLTQLGNTLVNPRELKDVLLEASLKSWADPEFVTDLKNWFRSDNNAEDGITPEPFNISRTDLIALRFAFRRGSIKSRALGRVFSSDVEVFANSPRAAVLSVPEMTPPALFEAGRRLLRSWVTIVGEEGYSYQPFSVGVDSEAAAAQVAEIAQVENPVALYRIGKATKPPRGLSNRKPLRKVIVE